MSLINQNTRVTVLGAVRSGVAAAKMIKELGGIPFVSDLCDANKLSEYLMQLKQSQIDFESGVHSERVFDCDLAVVSPGVPSNSDVVRNLLLKKVPIISELEFASQHCTATLIAITGTNGKTTTTSLMNHVLQTCGKKSQAAGNIGVALSDVALSLTQEDYVALEVSSFQLDFIDKFKPAISMILNITPDHLNRYDNDFAKYAQAKYRIFSNQDENDAAIINADDKKLVNAAKETKAKVFYFSLKNEIQNGCFLTNEKITFCQNGIEEFSCRTNDISLMGEHNYANVMAVIIAAKLLGCMNDSIIEALKTFPGVEHRLEFVKEINGVSYINDSKATNVDSVWYALSSINQPVYLILGGQDKGNDYSKIEDLVLSKVKKIYAIGSSADLIFNYFHKKVNVEIMQSLEDAVIIAHKETTNGDVVLLSPACASFDMFENYEHRGRIFKQSLECLAR